MILLKGSEIFNPRQLIGWVQNDGKSLLGYSNSEVVNLHILGYIKHCLLRATMIHMTIGRNKFKSKKLETTTNEFEITWEYKIRWFRLLRFSKQGARSESLNITKADLTSTNVLTWGGRISLNDQSHRPGIGHASWSTTSQWTNDEGYARKRLMSRSMNPYS